MATGCKCMRPVRIHLELPFTSIEEKTAFQNKFEAARRHLSPHVMPNGDTVGFLNAMLDRVLASNVAAPGTSSTAPAVGNSLLDNSGKQE